MAAILKDFSDVAWSAWQNSNELPMIVIYKNPADFPGKYVARIWSLSAQPKPTDISVVKESLEEIRKIIPINFISIGRRPEDDPVIVECWI